MTPPTTPAGYEPRDLSARLIGALALALFAGIACACVLIAVLFALFPHLPTAGPWWLIARQQSLPPGPHLEVVEGSSRPAIEAAARKRLEGYAWLDGRHGRTRIPIERAMQLLVERGWPDADDENKRSSP
ncbi:hypothetical protein [Enhydrobacter sp.]|jgi:hypothetical protein|uniref:hypothetical protein n=1 Tax=Enhydrobacter sp. TaxID=1894999 RepID=UPI00261AF1F5|nr:hypothetical protein [Enhydrobacter sp.]WIM12822.1 MAG: hypothetical protein OJF58_003785 [Enhydrobacter sp.]